MPCYSDGIHPQRTLTCVIKSCVTRSLRSEASFALWEDNFYISPPHVPNPSKTRALVEVVCDNIVAV